MAQIRETLTLVDQFSGTISKYIQKMQQAETSTKEMQDASRRAQAAARAQTAAMNAAAASARAESAALRLQEQQQKATASAMDSMTHSIRNLLGAFAGMQAVRWLVNTSDQLTSINARLQLMTGSAEGAAAAQEKIYQAAMRSRGAYADMADFVSQLGMTAGNAFRDTNELIAFAEQIQKQLAISGASGASAQAALVQLTQGLSSDALRGEELNSVLGQTPLIAKTIADYMGVTKGEMRELASEGKVTADVVKNAILGATAETNAQFEQMPMTWAQVWTMAQNIAIQALDPVLQAISWLANNIETVGPIVLSLGAAFAVFLVAANWTNICTAATTGLANAQKMLGAVMATTWGLPLIIIALVIGAIYAVTAAVNHFAGTSVSATGIIAGTFLSLFALLANGAIFIMNGFSDLGNFIGNVFNNPVAAVKVLFWDMATNILGLISNVAHGIESLVNAIPGVQVSITAGIDSLYNKAKSAAQTAKDESGWVEYFKHQDYIDLTGAFKTGYNWGANLFSGSSAGGYDLSAAYTPYNEISGQLDDISGSVGSIEKSVKMTDEDIKSLVDVAERRYVNNVNLTAQTPVITVNGQNTGHTAADRQNLANAIRDILIEQRASGSTRSTARPTTG